jgi:Arc/MetJ-type ribon-helix-helix transcriptional regulator
MAFSLIPEHEQFIQAQIEAGVYENADELLADAIRLLMARYQGDLKDEDDRLEATLENIEGIWMVKTSKPEMLNIDLVDFIRQQRDSRNEALANW